MGEKKSTQNRLKSQLKSTKWGGSSFHAPRRPQDWTKIQSREAISKKASFQYGMKFSIEHFFFPSPSSGRRKTGPGMEIFNYWMNISNREWTFQARMTISCVGECSFHCFPLISQEFEGFGGEKKSLFFFGGFLCFFTKKKPGKEGGEDKGNVTLTRALEWKFAKNISCVGECVFVLCVRARMIFSISGPSGLGVVGKNT